MSATTTITKTTPHDPTPYLSNLHSRGFVIVKSLLSPPEVDALRSACAVSTSQARAGQWPFIRTLPKQFPPWPSVSGPEGIWGVQHLMHPDQPGRDVFARSYFNPKLLAVVEEILGRSGKGPDSHGEADDGEELVMELYNLLVRPDSDFELRWHRDDIPPTATPSEELQALNLLSAAGTPVPKPTAYTHTQWNLALYPDSSLIVVPGTHARARTPTERAAGPHDVLPDQLEVKLEPGDVVFYDNDILHRGKYDSGKERATLHGSISKRGQEGKRARNVLQHGVGEWIESCGFDGLDRQARERAEGMRRNLVRMGRGGGKGFSQTD